LPRIPREPSALAAPGEARTGAAPALYLLPLFARFAAKVPLVRTRKESENLESNRSRIGRMQGVLVAMMHPEGQARRARGE